MDFLKFAGKIAGATLAGVAEADAKRAAKNLINNTIDRVNDECGTDFEHIRTSSGNASYEAQKRREEDYARRSGKALRDGHTVNSHCYVPHFVQLPLVTRKSSHTYFCENPSTHKDCEVEATYDLGVHFARCNTGAGEYDVTYIFTYDVVHDDIELDYTENLPTLGIICRDDCNAVAARYHNTGENWQSYHNHSYCIGQASDGSLRIVTENANKTYVFYQIKREYASQGYWVELSYPNAFRDDVAEESKLLEAARKLVFSYSEIIREI